jgi:hypothetical protein
MFSKTAVYVWIATLVVITFFIIAKYTRCFNDIIYFGAFLFPALIVIHTIIFWILILEFLDRKLDTKSLLFSIALLLSNFLIFWIFIVP